LTSITVVLIGAETSESEYVGYEIKQSHIKRNGMIGIYIHNTKNRLGLTDIKGKNPFANWHIDQNGKKTMLSDIYPTYDWVTDNGRDKIGDWIEVAAKNAER
jgi:hypothetical protein